MSGPHCETCTCPPEDEPIYRCPQCGTTVPEPRWWCVNCSIAWHQRQAQAAFDRAEQRHNTRLAEGKNVCMVRCPDLHWCLGVPLVGTSLCYSHAGEELRFAAAYGRHLGQMAVTEDDARERLRGVVHGDVSETNRRVAVFDAFANLERERLRIERRRLLS